MSGACTLGMYTNGGDFGRGSYCVTCTCDNCTEREATVMAEANARRKALLALDQAMTDLSAREVDIMRFEDIEVLEGRVANAVDAWSAARRFVIT